MRLRSPERPTLGLPALAALLAAPLPVSYGMPGSWRFAWTIAALGLVLTLWVLHIGRGRVWGGWVLVAYLALTAGVASGSNAVDASGHWQVVIQLVVLWGLAPAALLAASRRDPRVLPSAARAFVLVQSASAIVAIVQAVTGDAILWGLAVYGRSPGLSGHTNILGVLSAVAVLLCVGRGGKVGMSLAGVNLAGVLVSGSISSLAALVVGALVFAAVRRVPIGRLILAGGLIAAAVWAADRAARDFASLRSPLYRILQTTGQTDEVGTLGIRLETMRYAWDRILASPLLGVGLDDQSGATFDFVTLTHDLPLRAWFQGGLPLAVAVVLVFGMLLRAVLAAMKARTNAPEAASVATLLAFSLTSATLDQPYFWLVAIACWAHIVDAREAATAPVKAVASPPTPPRVKRDGRPTWSCAG